MQGGREGGENGGREGGEKGGREGGEKGGMGPYLERMCSVRLLI